MEVQPIVTTLPDTEMSAVGAETTVTVKDFESSNAGVPSSVTRTVMALVVFTSEVVVAQVKTPLDEPTVAPAGAPGSRLYDSVFAGRSESVAEFVKVRVWPA